MKLPCPLACLLLFLPLVNAPAAGDAVRAPQSPPAGGVPPKPIKTPPPQYPGNMLRAGLAGRVMMEFIIDTEGRVQNPIVVESNNPWFERPAIEAVLKWTFHPGEMGGLKVNTRARQLLDFNTDYLARGETGLWVVPRLRNPKDLPPELRWHTAPQPLNTAFPVYPFASLLAEQSGASEIRFIVGPDGRIVASQLLGSTHPEMGHAALTMIEAWGFTPPKMKDGTPCYAVLTMKHNFKPSGQGDVPVPDEAKAILRKLEKKPEEVFSLKELDRMPKPLSRRPPVYPTKLLKSGQTGEAKIEFFIAPNGDAHLPSIISSTATEFGYAAAQAVATWRFEAPVKDGKPATVRVRIPIEFGLPSAAPAVPAAVMEGAKAVEPQ